MKVLVSVKRVIDFNVKVRIKPDGSDVDLANVKMSINPFDEIAVEEAVRLKEKGIASELVVISLGSQESQETLRASLALGMDRAILIQTQNRLDPLIVAKALKEIILKEKPDLVILGKQAIDDDCNQTGQMLAGLLNWPQGTFISELKIDGTKVIILREVDGGLERLALTLPAVITTDLRLNTPRYPSLPNIMKAKQKPLETVSLESLNIEGSSKQTLLKVSEPPKRKGGIKVKTIQELIEKLHNDAGVL
jgi:electron transfer flavoprotein beta subunit